MGRAMRGALVTILILTVGVGVGPTPVPAAPVSGQPRPAGGNWGASAEAAPLAVNAASVPTSSVSLVAAARPELDFDFEEPRSLWAAESFPAAVGVTSADAQRRETRGVAVAAADLDANGSADLVSFAFQRSGNSTSGYVVVQRTDGFGGVETGTAYLVPLSTDVGDLALADVDGDGDIDVVVATGNVLTIVTLLNDGTGRLSTQLTTPTAEALTRTITLGDVDGDGIVDLVGLSGPARGARVYLGNGDGSFRPDATLSQSSPINVALLDADGDGTLEILVTSQESFPQLWRRAGNGTWAVVEGAMPNIFASATWVGDFDGDDDADVALLLGCVNLESLCLQPLRNNAGVFTALDAVAFQLPIAYFGASHPHIDGSVVDIDGDGRLDLAVPGRGGEIGIIFGVGDGTFVGWRTVNGATGWEPALAGGWDAAPVSGGVGGFPQNWGTGAAGRGVVAADVTGDGIVDLASVSGGSPIQRLAGSASGRLTLVEGTGSRGFVGSRAVPFTARDWRSDRWDDMTTVADWNGDGKADVVAIVRAQGAQPPALVVARGGEGGFAPGEVVGEVDVECVTRTRGQRFLVSDVDGDGALDVVCGGTNLWLARGDGAGGMLAIQELGPTTGGGTDLWGIDAVDMDGDDDLDIAYAASGSLSNMVLGWAENRVGEPAGPPTVGGFAAPAVIGTPDLPAPTTSFYYNGIRPRIVDMTADGLADLVVVSRAQASNGASTSSITVLVNGGHQTDGSFTFNPVRRELAGVDGQSSQIDVLDLDEDGLPDVILSELTSTSSYGDEGWDAVSLRSVGDGTFTPLQTFPVSSSAHGMRRLADLNGDGIGDLIEPTNYRSVQLRAGNGDGTFAPPTIFGTPGFNTPWAEPADFDGDGDLDIVGRTEPFDDARSFLPNNLVVLENLGGGGGPEPTPANLAAVSLEWQPGAGSASDPLTSVTAGRVRIQVTNTGGSRVAGQWTDTVWLSDDATFSVDDTLVLAVPRTGGLAAGATLDGTFGVTIAPHRAGPQHLILRTDVRGQVAESTETDNVASASPLDFAPPVLARPVGAAPSSGSFTSTGGPVIVRIPAGTGTLRLTVDGAASAVAVAVREGAVPTATVADDRLAGGTGTVLLLPGGDRYVWLDLPAGATARLVLENLAFGIGTVSPVIAGNAGPASFTLWGTGLGRVDEARAVSPTGAVLVATNLQPNADGTLAVTFDLGGAATGAYAIEVTDGRATSSLPAAFRVLAARAGTVRTTLFVPGMARPSGTGTTFITFANDGLSDVVAPIFRVRSRGVAAPADGPYPVGDFTVAASVPGAPVGIIPPGASGRIEIPWTQAGASVDGLGPGVATPRGAAYGFLVDEYGPGSIAPYDPAADYAEELATLSASDRAAVVDALEDTFGRTGDSYLRAIHAIRSRLARGGTVASDLGTPRRVAFDQAMAQLPGAAVQGTVTDASGDPMTFVRVRVLPAGGDDLFTVTDGAGRFSIRGVPDGTQVEVFLDSYGPTPLATATTPAPNLAVSVPAWAGLVGTVTDAGGRPAGGVTVTVADPATGAAITTTARGDGTYRFDGLAPGAYTLTATPSAGRPVTQALTVAAVPLAIDLQLPPSSTVVGRVVAPDGTTPVGGAQVLVRHDASGDSRTATAGDDGTFTLDGVTPGPSQLAVRAPGRPTTTTAVDLADGPVDVGDVTFEAGVTVTGTVTSSAGGPIGGAVVVSSTGATAETDVAGDFEMVGVPLGNVTLTAVSDSTLARSVVLDTTVATTADIELEPAALVTVLVTGAAGAPVPDVDVTLTPDGEGPPTAATTGDDGTAEFRVEPGDYTVATGLFSQLETFITGQQTVEIARTSSSLRGALPDTVRRGGETAPSSGITVWFDGGGRSEYVTTDEDGAFTVDGVAGTDAELWVHDPYLGVLHETVTFPALGETDDLGELVPDGDTLTIDLPWMDRTNAPLVYLQPAGLDGINRSFQVIPDAYDGEPLDDAVVVGHDTSIELRDLPAGDYRVTVLRALPGGGYEDAVVEFSFDGAATVTPEFPSSIAAEGTEVDGDGDPLAGALVELTSAAGVTPARRYQALTGDDGSWSVPVAEGEYRIEVRDLTTGALLSERDQEFPGGAPRPLNERSSLRRSASAVLDATAILAAIVPAGGVTPSESELKQAYADKFWPDDAPPTDGQVQQALARPFPRQPDDQCLILDTSALNIAKSDAQKAEDTRLLIQETVDQAQNEVLRMAAVAALQGIRLLNESINVVTGVKGFADAVATKAVTAGVRTAEKAADNASDVANAWIYTAEELESIQNWRETLKNVKELYDLTEKVFKGFLTAVTAAEPPLTADTVAAIGEAGQLVVQLATSLKAFAKFPAAGAAKELLGPVTALLNIYNLVYEVADQFNGAIALLDSLAEANAGLRRSYDFDLQRAHASWDNFLRVGFSLTVKSGCPPPDEPPPGPGGSYGTAWGVNFGSSDPNAITGAFGVGGERWVQADAVLTNEIHFENLGPGSNPDTRPPGVPNATAPAATVDIRLPLDPAVDLDTVALGRFGFGVGATEMIFEPAPGAQSFEEERPLVLTVPSLADPNTSEVLSLTMRVTALLDRGAREVRWLLTLVDPTTGLVHPNPLAGFLPPEPVAPQGAGGGFATVSYQADDAPTGTTVTARARIVFDDNDPLDTNTWSNRLDRTAPDTTITGGGTTAVGGTVSVGSTDEGSGPGLVDVWRSVDGGPLTLWKYRVDPGTIVLDGAAGQEIGLAARSSDLVFNREDVPTEVQFVTVLVEGTQPTQPTVPPSSTVPPQPTVPTEPTAPPQTTVPAPATTPPDTTAVAPDNRSLPRTGADTLPLLAMGLVLVGLGVVLRRARPAARPPRR